jgi:hypothetical protein
MRLLVLALLFLFIPFTSAIQISEIMYDLDGKDSGYEWVEVYNDGDAIDLCKLRFYEQETSHYIKGDDCQLASGKYAIIADKPENFDEACMIVDSAFSLSNSGELLCIRESEEDLFCVEYSSSLGAAGNGESLQFVDDQWISLEPTPCSAKENIELDQEQQAEQQEDLQLQQEEQENDESEDKPKETKQDDQVQAKTSELELVQSRQTSVYAEPETVGRVTGAVVYESKTEKQRNVPLLLLLTVSITLNVVFIASLIRKPKHERV